MAAIAAAYEASKDRKDRVFGKVFEDVWFRPPVVRDLKRLSTGDFFSYSNYNGGYPPSFDLNRGDLRLRADFLLLCVKAYWSEPIMLVGPARGKGHPERPWTADELHLIASFRQTAHEEQDKLDVASSRANGHFENAASIQRRPFRYSVVFDSEGRLPSLFSA
jgi:hypothetical protein